MRDDGFEGSKWQRREPKFFSYTDLNETPKRIYRDTRGQILYQKPARKEPTDRERTSEKYCMLHELEGYNTNDCKHLHDLIEEQVRNNQLQWYVWNRATMVKREQPSTAANENGNGSRSRIVISWSGWQKIRFGSRTLSPLFNKQCNDTV